jgi:hypothetical protein
VSDDFGDDVVTDSVNPLLRPLDPMELELLETIWSPISLRTAPWPVWDYVSHTLYQGPSQVHDAAAIFAALPTVPAGPGSGPHTAPYGLVWCSHAGPDISCDEHVGLTIAGLVRLAERRSALMRTADQLFLIITNLARRERALTPDPNKPVERVSDIESLIDGIAVGSSPTTVPPQAVADLLQHESVPLGITTGPGQVTANLTSYLRPFGTLQSAQEYVDLLAQMAQRRERPAPVRRGEELLQTLDYVSYVLATHPAWKPAGRLVVVQDLETAATLAADAGNQVEFDHRMSALATLLDGLQTPDPSMEAEEGWRKQVGAGETDRPRSLARLEIWLGKTLQDDARRRRALDAVKDLKSVKDLRNLGQHSGTGLRRRATQACGRLGIDEPIREPSQAWEIVRARVADAFDIIRREVVSGP